MKTLLGRFTDCFPDHLPARLPPFRDVNHEIDLEPGSSRYSPPSRPAYRMSKPEIEELEKLLLTCHLAVAMAITNERRS